MASATVRLSAFKVIKPLTQQDIDNIRGSNPDLSQDVKNGLFPLKQGFVGYMPHIVPNILPSGHLRPYLHVELHQPMRAGYEAVNTGSPTPGRAWVPSQNIKLGSLRPASGTESVVSDVAATTLRVRRAGSISFSSNNVPLKHFLMSFLETCVTSGNAELLKEFSVDDRMIEGIQNSRDRENLVNNFLDGMKYCHTFELFKNGIPPFRQIWDTCRYVKGPSQNPNYFRAQGGCYFYLQPYYNPNDHKGTKHGIYDGRTVEQEARDSSHYFATQNQNPRLAHYRMAAFLRANGAERRLFPITFISRSISNHHVMFTWAETLIVALFDSYSQDLLDCDPKANASHNVESRTGVARAVGLNVTTTSPARLGFIRAHIAPLANFLTKLARELKQQHFRNFKLDIKFYGCNWSVPLLEALGAPDVAPWIRIPILNSEGQTDMFIFSTSPRRLSAKRFLCIMTGRNETAPFGLTPILGADEYPDLQSGSYVNAIIEIMATEGQSHPFPYVQIPTVGPFDNWKEASRMAIRVEFWSNTQGSWVSHYLQWNSFSTYTEHKRRVNPKDIHPVAEREHLECMEMGWLKCIKTMGALLQWRFLPQNNDLVKRVWVPFKAKVRQVQFDFMKQAWILTTTNRTDRPQPKLQGFLDNALKIQVEFGSEVCQGWSPGPEVTWRERPFGEPKQHNHPRELCDQCRVAGRPTTQDPLPKLQLHHARYCTKSVVVIYTDPEGREHKACKLCYRMRRLCTWTADIERRKNEFPGLVYTYRPAFPTTLINEPASAISFLERQDREDAGVNEDEVMDAQDDG